MDLRAWRQSKKLFLDTVATRLGMRGANPARGYQRVETGQVPADADLVAAIERLTEGLVTADDMHRTRLAFLERSGKARAFAPPAALAEAS